MLVSSAIIQEIDTIRKSGLASLAFFYCDFRDDQKKDRRGLLSSFLVQLCDHSDAYYDTLHNFYLDHSGGSRHPSDTELVRCLKDILERPGQPPVYLAITSGTNVRPLSTVTKTTSFPPSPAARCWYASYTERRASCGHSLLAPTLRIDPEPRTRHHFL
jgi:hypothetical protein